MVLIDNDIDAKPFSTQVLACLPPLPWSVSSEDLANPIRLDLRDLRVFSVDPPGMWLIYWIRIFIFSLYLSVCVCMKKIIY